MRFPGAAAVLIFLFSAASLCGDTPAEERWQEFMAWNPGPPRIPEDEELGLLADRRNPDPRWAGALEVCDEAFDALAGGEVPEDLILPAIRVPQARDFRLLLESGRPMMNQRYGLPVRVGDRLDVPVRVTASGSGPGSIGRIYLARQEGRWFIEQWVLDLSPFVAGAPPDGGDDSVSAADEALPGGT